ncbi:MAG TPA: hypothetical protein DEF02_00485 [Clostridiales bacterium]|nr:hypothetical protein [Clostridiales bacterium]
MRDELKKYGDEAYEMVRYAANEIGPRLPGSDNEKKYHEYMSDKLKEIGLNPVTESFVFAPHASIGGLPYAGWAGIIGCILTVIATMLAHISTYAGLATHFVCTVYMAFVWIWLFVSVFKYRTCFDWCFKHKVSHNTYAELLPEDGKYDYTIFLSGHTDTSWTLKLSASQNKLGFVGVVLRLGIGAIAVGVVTIMSVVALILIMILQYGSVDSMGVEAYMNTVKAYDVLSQIILYSSPVAVVCAFLLTMYNEKTEAIASPGAMDNATGVSIAYQVLKYYKENPDKMPKNCRIVDFNVGAEESGLRGSIAFTRKHKDDGMLDNAYHINIDSIADHDYFAVINGDSWLCPHFDKDLERMFKESMREAGIEKPGDIANPVGGCDSTPFQKAGVKSITFAAQNPVMSDYYHTYRDVPERFSPETVGLGLDVVLRVISKIDESRAK